MYRLLGWAQDEKMNRREKVLIVSGGGRREKGIPARSQRPRSVRMSQAPNKFEGEIFLHYSKISLPSFTHKSLSYFEWRVERLSVSCYQLKALSVETLDQKE